MTDRLSSQSSAIGGAPNAALAAAHAPSAGLGGDGTGEDGSFMATPEAPEAEMRGPHRRCLVSREVLPKTTLVRFVVGPNGVLAADLEERLPGRGMWVKADRAALATAISRRLFAKAARAPVEVPAELVDRVGALLAARCLGLIGLARRAGQVVAGFEKVHAALAAGKVGLLLAASDGAPDGRRKLAALARGTPILELFTSAELSAALGRDNTVHAAIAPGGLTERLAKEAGRLAGLRATA